MILGSIGGPAGHLWVHGRQASYLALAVMGVQRPTGNPHLVTNKQTSLHMPADMAQHQANRKRNGPNFVLEAAQDLNSITVATFQPSQCCIASMQQHFCTRAPSLFISCSYLPGINTRACFVASADFAAMLGYKICLQH